MAPWATFHPKPVSWSWGVALFMRPWAIIDAMFPSIPDVASLGYAFHWQAASMFQWQAAVDDWLELLFSQRVFTVCVEAVHNLATKLAGLLPSTSACITDTVFMPKVAEKLLLVKARRAQIADLDAALDTALRLQ